VESQLRGGHVDAIGKAGQCAETQLPKTITHKVQKRPDMFAWQMKEKIILGVLNELDGNG
jgi:hypothetical protein